MTVFKSLKDSGLASLLEQGKVGIIPTDTVYGIVCIASNEQSVARLYSLKSRLKNPGPMIAANIDQLVNLGIKRSYLKAVEQFWPNPISIEIPHNITYLNQSTGRQAMRIVKGSPDLIALLNKVGPLLTTSANPPNDPPANNIVEAQKYFGDKIDFYVDGGDLSDRESSTLIRVVDDAVEVVREGEIKVSESGEILN